MVTVIRPKSYYKDREKLEKARNSTLKGLKSGPRSNSRNNKLGDIYVGSNFLTNHGINPLGIQKDIKKEKSVIKSHKRELNKALVKASTIQKTDSVSGSKVMGNSTIANSIRGKTPISTDRDLGVIVIGGQMPILAFSDKNISGFFPN